MMVAKVFDVDNLALLLLAFLLVPTRNTALGACCRVVMESEGNPRGFMPSDTRASTSRFRGRTQSKGLDVDSLYVVHAQCNRAPKQRRRTYRAHGRINRECVGV